jgi:hypothetical protein
MIRPHDPDDFDVFAIRLRTILYKYCSHKSVCDLRSGGGTLLKMINRVPGITTLELITSS